MEYLNVAAGVGTIYNQTASPVTEKIDWGN